MYYTRLLLVLLFCIPGVRSYASGYPEVLFSNSVMSGNYGFSLVSYSGFSWVENIKGRVPLNDTLSFTPGNSVSLRYTSSSRGHWELALYYPEKKPYRLRETDEVLSMRIYLMDHFDPDAMPRISLLQGDTCSAERPLSAYLPEKPATGRWYHIRIPLSEIPGLQASEGIHGLLFSQGRPTGIETVNHLLLDQIEFAQAEPPKIDLNFPAILDKVTGYEKHVDIEWELPLNPGIRYAKIYRSEDGKHFETVALQPILALSYTDVVPSSGKTYHYKITWVDYHYDESPFSAVLAAETKSMDDHALLDVVQHAHINFFVRMAEFNSGMHALDLTEDNALVSVEDSGYSLMAQTVGASRGWIPLRMYLRRLGNMVDFLEKAEQYHGVYPALLDGRTGKAVYDQDSVAYVSLKSTASLIQGLLIARNYIKSLESVTERRNSLVRQIDQLWRRAEWNRFALENGQLLYDHWSPQTGFKDARPMGGFGSDYMSYFLALASPDFAISDEAYKKGLGASRVLVSRDSTISHTAVGLVLENRSAETDSLVLQPKYKEILYRTDTLMYGFYLDVGRVEQPLLEAYMPFFTLDPREKRDMYANYDQSLIRLIQAYKRRDNEMDAGNASPDIWGTSQDGQELDHLPNIMPANSISGFAILPNIGMRALRRLYLDYGRELFTENGFRDWINIHEHQVSATERAINKAAIPVMIENGRTGLLWKLFMEHEDIARTTHRFFREDKTIYTTD